MLSIRHMTRVGILPMKDHERYLHYTYCILQVDKTVGLMHSTRKTKCPRFSQDVDIFKYYSHNNIIINDKCITVSLVIVKRQLYLISGASSCHYWVSFCSVQRRATLLVVNTNVLFTTSCSLREHVCVVAIDKMTFNVRTFNEVFF